MNENEGTKTLIALLLGFVCSSCQCGSGPRHFNELAVDEEKNSGDVIPLLEIKEGEVVADLGAGGGYFSIKLAAAVGEHGRVYAIDIDRESLEYIEDYAKSKGALNLQTVLGTMQDSRLKPSSVDLVFVRNTYHDIQNRVAYFKRLKAALKPAGRIAIIDYDPDKLGTLRKLHGHYLEKGIIVEEMKQAGYQLQESIDRLKFQSFTIFRSVAQDKKTSPPNQPGD